MTDRKFYAELEYTLDLEASKITIGLHRKANNPDEHPVHLFPSDAGILASVTLSEAPASWDWDDDTDVFDKFYGLQAALELASEEIHNHLPVDLADIELEPWRVLIIDHDLMEANLQATPLLAKSNDVPSDPA